MWAQAWMTGGARLLQLVERPRPDYAGRAHRLDAGLEGVCVPAGVWGVSLT